MTKGKVSSQKTRQTGPLSERELRDKKNGTHGGLCGSGTDKPCSLAFGETLRWHDTLDCLHDDMRDPLQSLSRQWPVPLCFCGLSRYVNPAVDWTTLDLRF